jgi:hypothetical protein
MKPYNRLPDRSAMAKLKKSQASKGLQLSNKDQRQYNFEQQRIYEFSCRCLQTMETDSPECRRTRNLSDFSRLDIIDFDGSTNYLPASYMGIPLDQQNFLNLEVPAQDIEIDHMDTVSDKNTAGRIDLNDLSTIYGLSSGEIQDMSQENRLLSGEIQGRSFLNLQDNSLDVDHSQSNEVIINTSLSSKNSVGNINTISGLDSLSTEANLTDSSQQSVSKALRYPPPGGVDALHDELSSLECACDKVQDE